MSLKYDGLTNVGEADGVLSSLYRIPEMASPYADALPDFAGPGRRVLRWPFGSQAKVCQFPKNNVI